MPIHLFHTAGLLVGEGRRLINVPREVTAIILRECNTITLLRLQQVNRAHYTGMSNTDLWFNAVLREYSFRLAFGVLRPSFYAKSFIKKIYLWQWHIVRLIVKNEGIVFGGWLRDSVAKVPASDIDLIISEDNLSKLFSDSLNRNKLDLIQQSYLHAHYSLWPNDQEVKHLRYRITNEENESKTITLDITVYNEPQSIINSIDSDFTVNSLYIKKLNNGFHNSGLIESLSVRNIDRRLEITLKDVLNDIKNRSLRLTSLCFPKNGLAGLQKRFEHMQSKGYRSQREHTINVE